MDLTFVAWRDRIVLSTKVDNHTTPKGNIISKNVTCEACYEVPAIITALLPMGSEIPMCKKCAIESMNYALEGRGGLYVAQDTDD
jgi:hypothetical protein